MESARCFFNIVNSHKRRKNRVAYSSMLLSLVKIPFSADGKMQEAYGNSLQNKYGIEIGVSGWDVKQLWHTIRRQWGQFGHSPFSPANEAALLASRADVS